ncbi:MAG: Major facilitator superfamily, partial [Microgenomates group bacterium GW2011_GWC2_45_8]
TVYLGLLSGLAAGFYWSAHEVMVLSGTSDKTREMFYGVLMSGESAARIVGPALAGGLIWLGIKLGGDDLSGYYLLFASLAGLFLSAELVIKKTRDVSFNQFTLTGVFSLYRRRAWRWNLWRSFVDGLMISRVLVWSVLSYLILESETWLGMMMSVVGVLSIISNLLIGHWFKRNLRAKLNTWGVGFLVIAGVLYPLLLSPVGLLADQILGEVVGIPLFTFAWLAWFFLAVETDYEGEKRQFEYYAGHEIWQGAGRMLSIGGFWFLAGQLEQIGLARWWFGGLSLLFIVQWWLVQKVRQALVKAGYKED